MKDHESNYTVHVEGEIILITPIGSQSPAAVRSIREEVEALLAGKRPPKDILVDNTKAGLPGKQATEVALIALKEVPFRRIAIFTDKPEMLLSARDLLKRSGSEERFKIFRDENMARAWLKESSHPVRTRLEQKKDRILRRHED
jgi:hypothetical protein